MLRYLLFDLDGTLYSETSGLEKGVFQRMNEFVAELYGITVEEAIELRKVKMPNYGTTLEWIMDERGFSDVDGYYARVHPDGEEECLSPDPALGRLLDSIPLPKAVFTNAPMEHADRVLAKLGLASCFEAVYDIRYNELVGKPHAKAVRRVCSACGVSPAEALFIDDIPRYVQGFVDCGGRGLLIDESGRHASSSLPRIRSLVELPGILAGEGVALDPALLS